MSDQVTSVTVILFKSQTKDTVHITDLYSYTELLLPLRVIRAFQYF